MVSITLAPMAGLVQRMVDSDVGSFDTRYERLTDHYRDMILHGKMKPGDRFPSAVTGSRRLGS